MPHTLQAMDGLKQLLAVAVLAVLLFLYFDTLADIGDLYPDMIWDEVASGILGAGLVVLWYRAATKCLKK